MTCVEFFDNNYVKNLVVSLSFTPERVILVGDNNKQLKKHAELYERIFSKRGANIAFERRSVNGNNLDAIVSALCEIVNTYDDCVFDVTGGEDLYLVAAGVVRQMYAEKNIRIFRYNIKSGVMHDCIALQNPDLPCEPAFGVEDNIHIYGGSVVYDTDRPGGTHAWDFDDELLCDIDRMWQICRGDVRLWNTQISVFEAACRHSTCDGLTVKAPVNELEQSLHQVGGKLIFNRFLIASLERAGLISGCSCSDDELEITFKNSSVKRCLTKAGQVLEMKVCISAMRARDVEGEPVYGDVMTGVSIDWDGKISEDAESPDTQNEIDVIMMRGIIPIFVSCKNGYVEMDELYKLDAVAKKFGGKYAKKVLVATALDPDDMFTKHFKSRADDMGIRLVLDFCDLSDEEIEKRFRTFCL